MEIQQLLYQPLRISPRQKRAEMMHLRGLEEENNSTSAILHMHTHTYTQKLTSYHLGTPHTV